jgi:hypothetical protein
LFNGIPPCVRACRRRERFASSPRVAGETHSIPRADGSKLGGQAPQSHRRQGPARTVRHHAQGAGRRASLGNGPRAPQ